jgi:hypothetical protein
MAFNGSLLKVSGTEFPLTYVLSNSYKVAPNRRLDLDSNRDATGELRRTTLEHTATTITLTVKRLTNTQLNEMMTFIRNRYILESEKKVSLEYYCPDIDDYKTGTFYLADFEYIIDTIDIESKIIRYKEFNLDFIEY